MVTYTSDEIKKLNQCSKIVAKRAKGRGSEGLCIFSLQSIDSVESICQCEGPPHMTGDIFCVDVVRDYRGNFRAITREKLGRTENAIGITGEWRDKK
jgi:hypothetical protein